MEMPRFQKDYVLSYQNRGRNQSAALCVPSILPKFAIHFLFTNKIPNPKKCGKNGGKQVKTFTFFVPIWKIQKIFDVLNGFFHMRKAGNFTWKGEPLYTNFSSFLCRKIVIDKRRAGP